MNILTPKTLSHHITIKVMGDLIIIMSDHTKYMISSYGHGKLFDLYIISQWQKQRTNGIKPNFLSDID